MKYAISALALGLIIGFAASAKEPRFYEEAKQVQQAIMHEVIKVKGVNSVGLTACDSRTGQIDRKHGEVYCVVIGVETRRDKEVMERTIYPGSQIDGIYIVVEHVGKIRPQPRMSGGK